MRIRLEKKGCISENEYGGGIKSKADNNVPATTTSSAMPANKRLILKNFQTPLSVKSSQNFVQKMTQRDEGNNAVSIDPSLNNLSLHECLSTKKRV